MLLKLNASESALSFRTPGVPLLSSYIPPCFWVLFQDKSHTLAQGDLEFTVYPALNWPPGTGLQVSYICVVGQCANWVLLTPRPVVKWQLCPPLFCWLTSTGGRTGKHHPSSDRQSSAVGEWGHKDALLMFRQRTHILRRAVDSERKEWG